MHRQHIVILVLVLLVAACTCPKDPREANFFQMIWCGDSFTEGTDEVLAENEALKARLVAEQASIPDLQMTVRNLEGQVGVMQKELTTIDVVMHNVDARLAELRAQEKISTAKAAELQQKHDLLRARVNHLQAADPAVIQQKQAEIKRLEKEIADLLELMQYL